MRILGQIVPPTTAPLDTLSASAVGLEELFGVGATESLAPTVEALPELSATQHPVVGLLLMALFVGYALHLVVHGGYIPQMWKVVVGDNVGIRVADELSYLFIRALRSGIVMGLFTWSLAAMRLFELSEMGGDSPLASSMWLGPMLLCCCIAVLLLQRFLTLAVCGLVRRPDVAEGLNLLSDTTMALVTIAATPFTLLFVANVGPSAGAMGIAALVIASIGLLGFIIKSLIFFIEQKISILLWFLYLCTVILIPIGTVLVITIRAGVA